MPIPSYITYGFTVEKKGASPKLINQVHGNNVLSLTEGATPSATDADAVITPQGNAYVFTADCLPVLFFSEDRESPVAAVHAGWKGLKARVIQTVWDELQDLPGPWHVVLGPCLLKCCFEVKADFIQAFTQSDIDVSDFIENREGKTFFDPLSFVLQMQLPEEVILHRKEVTCTKCNPKNLPSFRRTGGTDPHIKAWIKKLVQK